MSRQQNHTACTCVNAQRTESVRPPGETRPGHPLETQRGVLGTEPRIDLFPADQQHRLVTRRAQCLGQRDARSEMSPVPPQEMR
jgi:hypothetical protein